MKNLLFATTNEFKLKESRDILSCNIDSISLDLEEIQETDVEKVVLNKVLKAYDIVKRPVMVEDSGLYFNALNGFPGALIKLLIDKIGTNGSLSETESKNGNVSKLLLGLDNYGAYAKTCFAFTNSSSEKDVIIVDGVVNGLISKDIRGKNGFGWDDIFIPDGYDKTFAEMDSFEKNQISPRRLALDKLKVLLNKRNIK